MKFNLDSLLAEFEDLEKQLSDPEIFKDQKKVRQVAQKKKAMEEAVLLYKEYKAINEALEENKEMLDGEKDEEMREMLKEEIIEWEHKIPEFEDKLKLALLPKDPNDDRNIIVELRAGAGGDEAAIFVGDLFDAYTRYADLRGWKIEIISTSPSDSGGYKEVTALIKGEQVYSRLKYEGGTHRVQRVPATESQGRVHTSAITVAVMPEVDDVEVVIEDKDLKIDVMRSSGCGGQSVNTTDSAVRITHLPSGLVVTNQDQKSQHKNREKAMKVLKARLYDLEMQEQQSENAAERAAQVGSGDRSGRIRTYNYPQNRISDHRINLTLYRLNEIMSGGLLDEIVEPLIADHQTKIVEAAGL